MPHRADHSPGFPAIATGLFSVLYLLMLVYGTLFPLSGWGVPSGGFFRYFLEADPARLSATDIITNVLVYMPAGVLWASLLSYRLRWPAAVLIATVAGAALSFTLEALQVFLPARNSALSDLVLNTLGTAIGGGAALLVSAHTGAGGRLRHFREQSFVPGTLVNVGLIVLGLWSLSQLSPLVPSLSISNLREGLRPIWMTVTGQSAFIVSQALVYLFSVIGLGGIFLSLCRRRGLGFLLFSLIIGAVLVMKILVISRQLSLEAALGCAAALLMLLLLYRMPGKVLVIFAGLGLLLSYLVDGLRDAGTVMQTYAFNWVPFRGDMQNIAGLANILAGSWLFLGAGYLMRYLCPPTSVVAVASVGALLIGALVALVEFLQLGIPGRVGDVTDILVAVAAWCCAWVGSSSRRHQQATKLAHGNAG